MCIFVEINLSNANETFTFCREYGFIDGYLHREFNIMK